MLQSLSNPSLYLQFPTGISIRLAMSTQEREYLAVSCLYRSAGDVEVSFFLLSNSSNVLIPELSCTKSHGPATYTTAGIRTSLEDSREDCGRHPSPRVKGCTGRTCGDCRHCPGRSITLNDPVIDGTDNER